MITLKESSDSACPMTTTTTGLSASSSYEAINESQESILSTVSSLAAVTTLAAAAAAVTSQSNVLNHNSQHNHQHQFNNNNRFQISNYNDEDDDEDDNNIEDQDELNQLNSSLDYSNTSINMSMGGGDEIEVDMSMENEEYNSPIFLKSSQSSVILSPYRSIGSSSGANSPLNASTASSTRSTASPRLLGFAITRSTSHHALLESSDSVPTPPRLTSPMSPKRLARNEKAKSSPPTSSPVSFLLNNQISTSTSFITKNHNQQQQQHHSHGNHPHIANDHLLQDHNNQSYYSTPNLNQFKPNSNNNNNQSKPLFTLVPTSSNSLIPLVEEESERKSPLLGGDFISSSPSTSPSLSSLSNHLINGSQSSSPGSSSPVGTPIASRSRSNSKSIIYSPTRSRSTSISTPTHSPQQTCKMSPPQPSSNLIQNNNNNNNIELLTTNNSTTNNSNSNSNSNLNQSNKIDQSYNNNMSTLTALLLKTSTPTSVNTPPLPPQTPNNNNINNNNNYKILQTPSTPSSLHVSIQDFTLIEKIGEGGFGQVYLATKNDTKEVVALKRMSKDLIWSKNKVQHAKTERDILAQGRNHRYIVSLVYSFQDETHLYLAMEYVPGGDLRSLLGALGCLEEDNARFYMAEMVEAVDSCHRLGYCHRDLKPENFLIDRTGHIKLADFGLSKNVVTRYVKAAEYKGTPTGSSMEHTPMKFGSFNNNSGVLSSSVTDFSSFGSFKDIQKQSALAYSVVGSPFYMAPEVLQATKGYGDEVDWWSLGCMFYEFVVGIPPFDGESPEEVMESVLKWRSHLRRPAGVIVSDELWDLITRLVCDGRDRLGGGDRGVENIKQHKFFQGIQWGKLYETEPPFVPVLDNDFDTSYFEKDRTTVAYTSRSSGETIKSKSNRNILGFTYPRAGEDPLTLSNLLKGIMNSSSNGTSSSLRGGSSSRSSGGGSLKTSSTTLTFSSPSNNTSPSNSTSSCNGSIPDPASPYGSYHHNRSLSTSNISIGSSRGSTEGVIIFQSSLME